MGTIRSGHRTKAMLRVLAALIGTLAILCPEAVLAVDPSSAGDSPAERLSSRGLSSFERGAYEEAASDWEQAALLYGREGKPREQAETLRRLSLAHQFTGRLESARKDLETALAVAKAIPDRGLQAKVLGRLGSLALAAGQDEAAARYLDEGLAMARESNDRGLAASILNDRGTGLANRRKFGDAVEAFRECVRLADESGNALLAVQALANAGMSAQRNGQHRESLAMTAEALDRIQGRLSTHRNAYVLINVALTLGALRPHLPERSGELLRVADNVFQVAADVSERIGDARTASYAWGYLGALREGERQYSSALRATRRAASAAQRIDAPEALYRWQWQAGRLLRATGSDEDALSAYRNAIHSLQSVRRETPFGTGDPRSGFRDTVRPVYVEFVDMLLRRAASLEEPARSEPYLSEAREALELFKVAEVRDYFQDDCVDAARSGISRLDRLSGSTAVVYPVILPDRLELLVSLPAGLRRFSVPVGADALTREVREFRRKLEKRTTNEYLPHARTLYDWLIRPIEPGLAASPIDTLVFVPDGPLRTIPMAALNDGREFLVRRYALAVTPGLILTDPRAVNREAPKLMAFGLTQSVQGFSPLPFVSAELKNVRDAFRGRFLVDRDFTVPAVEDTLKNEKFTIIHIASHGKFEDSAEKSFVLTFDDRLTVSRLDSVVGISRYREDPLDLLTLSACETAVGDDRAALGLAGIAIKAGARSALATLWHINDRATSRIVAEFYRQLGDPKVSRAAALQRAQIEMLGAPQYGHPGYWAPFLLINNWL